LGLTFREPRELLIEIEAKMKPISSAELFNDPAYKPLLESWCAAIFGLGYWRAVAPCKVALNTSGARADIDFYLQADDQQFGFQLTEVQEPGRSRGYESREPGRRPRRPPLEDERRGKADGPAWILEGVQKKVRKYGSAGRDLNLLVYADFATDQMDANAVANKLEPIRGAFNSVWVMDSVRIFSAYSSAALGKSPTGEKLGRSQSTTNEGVA
jgi:hypothetical protein